MPDVISGSNDSLGNATPIRCRVVACREARDDGREWSFYLINDSADPFDWAVLYDIGWEWGDFGDSEAADVRVAGLAPVAHALIWRDDGSGAEFRMELSLRVGMGGREAQLRFEFPKLYLQHNMQQVDSLALQR